jgi:hypothetical protein
LTPSVTIAKLEALLARVVARSSEARDVPLRPEIAGFSAPSASPPPAAPVSTPPAAVVAVPAPAPIALVPPIADAAPPAVAPAAVDDEVEKPTTPPPAMRPPTLDEPDIDLPPAVEVTIDNGPDIVVGEATASDEALLDEVSDSRERLVAADELEAPAESVITEVEEEVEDDAKGDEAPASSRRPVAAAPEERLAELAFGSEEPSAVGRTPPPKSGPLPAPPLDFDSDVTGVRKSVPPSPELSEPMHLTPQVARLQMAEGRDPVVDVIGEAQRFAPLSIVSLLEASLSL